MTSHDRMLACFICGAAITEQRAFAHPGFTHICQSCNRTASVEEIHAAVLRNKRLKTVPRQETYLCDACGVDITERAKRWGLVVTVGYSKGGWGHRENSVNWKGEVCRACYHVMGEKTARFFDAMKGACREGDGDADLPGVEPGLPKARIVDEWRPLRPLSGFLRRLRSLW
jgi:hypothetical protein